MIEDNRTQLVKEISNLHLEGHIIPHSWYRHIRHPNTNPPRPDFWAIAILSDILYWYRHTIQMEEETNTIISLKKRFKADLLQKQYKDYAKQFAAPEKTIANSFKLLSNLGLVKLHFRHVKLQNGRQVCNRMFIEPVFFHVSYITNTDNAYQLPPLYSLPHVVKTGHMDSEKGQKNIDPELSPCGQNGTHGQKSDPGHMDSEKGQKNIDTKTVALPKNNPNGHPCGQNGTHGSIPPQWGHNNTIDYFLHLPNGKCAPHKTSVEQSHSQLETILIDLFNWAKPLTIHFNTVCPTSFSIPASHKTKRMNDLLKYMQALQSGKIKTYTWDTKWLSSNKVNEDTLSQLKGRPMEEIKLAVYKAARRYAKAKADSQYWFPGNRKTKLSIDEFVYTFNQQVGIEGQSQLLYWMTHTPTVRYNTAIYEQTLAPLKIDYKQLATICFPRDVDKITKWTNGDSRDFLMGAARILLWYEKNAKTLRARNELWGVHLGTVMDLYKKLGAYYDEGGWMTFPVLPYPDSTNQQWLRFVRWMKEDFHINLLIDGNGKAKDQTVTKPKITSENEINEIVDGIWDQ